MMTTGSPAPSRKSNPAEHPAAMEPLLTSKQAATVLAVSERTLWSMRTSGEIPFISIRSAVRFSPDDLHAWIMAHRCRR